MLAHVLSGMRAVGWGRKSPHMNQPLTLIMNGTRSLAPTFHAYTHFLLAVRMVIIAPRELGQGSDAVADKK